MIVPMVSSPKPMYTDVANPKKIKNPYPLITLFACAIIFFIFLLVKWLLNVISYTLKYDKYEKGNRHSEYFCTFALESMKDET